MKGTITTLILSFISNLLSFSSSYASNRGEAVIASWEREADGRIWSEHVLNPHDPTLHGSSFKLNALCDHKSFEEAAAIRSEMISAIKNDLSVNSVSNTTEICGIILKRYASIGITPLRAVERLLISRLYLSEKKPFGDTDSLVHNERKNGREALTAPSTAVNFNSQRRDIGRDRIRNNSSDFYANCLDSKVNLRDYSLYFDKVDYFSLILYLWEDNPFDRAPKKITPTHLNEFSCNLLSYKPNSHSAISINIQKMLDIVPHPRRRRGWEHLRLPVIEKIPITSIHNSLIKSNNIYLNHEGYEVHEGNILKSCNYLAVSRLSACNAQAGKDAKTQRMFSEYLAVKNTRKFTINYQLIQLRALRELRGSEITSVLIREQYLSVIYIHNNSIFLGEST